MDSEPINLTELVGKKDRDLLVTGLQALHRERLTAFKTVADYASQQGLEAPNIIDFGVGEVAEMLRRVGAGPFPF